MKLGEIQTKHSVQDYLSSRLASAFLANTIYEHKLTQMKLRKTIETIVKCM